MATYIKPKPTSKKSHDTLILRGVREHNLKNINLDLPHGKLIAITGLSGSGKSSLAFNTIFAEGQRRFIDSLSTYARQFLERMERPDFDKMENVQPTIAIEQKNRVKTSRSTVGTATEIYDYLRLLFAKVGRTYCPKCKIEVKQDRVSDVVDYLIDKHGKNQIFVTFPKEFSKNRKDMLLRIGGAGLSRAYIKGKEVDIINETHKNLPSVLNIVVDRLIPSSSDRVRLSEAVESCYLFGGGLAQIFVSGNSEPIKFNQHFCCTKCSKKFLEPAPLLFSFNSPYGACPECKGFGNKLLLDEHLIIPNPELSLKKGAIEPFTKPSWKRRGLKLLDFAKREKIPITIPYKDLNEAQVKLIWDGKGKEKGIYKNFARLERKKYKMSVRVFLSRYKSPFTCEVCSGGRLKKEATWIKVNKLSITEVVKKNVDQILDFIKSANLGKQEKAISKD